MILVTAAAGKTGSHIVEALRARGERVRALGRTERVHALETADVETVSGDMLDAEVLRRALDDVKAVVHIGPRLHPLEIAMGKAVVMAASSAGVDRFVQMSVAHPQLEFLVNHQTKLRVEDFVVSSGLRYTILQPMHYLQNLDPAAIAREGVLRQPYSTRTPLSFVDLADVAEVAAKVLTEDGHVYATYPLCGSDLLSTDDVAAIIAQCAGKPIRSEEVTIPDFVETIMHGNALPHYVVDALYRLFTYYGLHGITGNPNVLRWLLRREPGTLEDYVRRSLDPAPSR